MSKSTEPPTPKYRYTLVIDANSHEEIEAELISADSRFLFDSDHWRRDTFGFVGGRTSRLLEHLNPDMTPERYKADLDQWWGERKAARASDGPVSGSGEGDR